MRTYAGIKLYVIFGVLLYILRDIQCGYTSQESIDIVDIDKKSHSEIIWNSIISPKCENKLRSMLTHPATDPDIPPFLLYSGKEVNSLGEYLSCRKVGNSRYILLEMKNNSPFKMMLGVCVPALCTITEYNNLMKNGLLREILPVYLNYSNLEIGNLEIDVEESKFIDPIDEEEKYGALGVGFWVVIFLVIIFIFTNLLAFVYHNIWSIYTRGTKVNKVHLLFQYFNPIYHLKSLVGENPKEDKNLYILNGIRMLGLWWVVIGHIFLSYLEYPSCNPTYLLNFIRIFWYAWIYNATFSVDIFFMLSGFLLGFHLLRLIAQGTFTVTNWKHWLLIVLHRLIRIYPLLIISLLIATYILPALGNGPYREAIYKQSSECKSYSWSVLLFLYNFLPSNIKCIDYVWYLSDDIQFFLIALPIIYIYNRRRIWGISALLFLILGSILVQIILILNYNLSMKVSDMNQHFFEYYYTRPYNRINPYLIGLLLSFFYSTWKRGTDSRAYRANLYIYDHLWIRIFFWTTGVFLMLLIIFDMYAQEAATNTSQSLKTLYLIFSRPTFVIGLIFFIYPTMLGKGKLLNNIFSGNINKVLGYKLGYGVYMMHDIIIYYFVYTRKTAFYINPAEGLLHFWGYLIISYLCALITLICVEAPKIKKLTEVREFICIPLHISSNTQNIIIKLKANTKKCGFSHS